MADHQLKVSLEKVLKGIPEEQATNLIEALKDFVLESVQEVIQPRLATLFKEIGYSGFKEIGYSGEVAALTRMLASKSGDTLEGTLLKALTLYGLALDAVQGGDRLAILNPDDEIVRNIVGFEATDMVGEALAK